MTTAIHLFEEMNTYNSRVNLDLIEHLITQNPKEERLFTLMSHIVNAHQIWLERILGEEQKVKVFEVRDLETLRERQHKNSELTFEILGSRNLEETVHYTNTKGQRYSNSICQILLHVFNHSSYHRGQINQLLVREGKPAMVSDYIFYNRTEAL